MEQRHSTAMSLAMLQADASRMAPPIVRGSMVPRPWMGMAASLAAFIAPGPGRTTLAGTPAPSNHVGWEHAAWLRRRLLTLMVVFATALATVVLSDAQPSFQYPWLQGTQTALFALLFAWVTAGCFTAVMGFVVLVMGDRHALPMQAAGHGRIDPKARTAIIMPICNENVATVSAGLRATCESLMGTGMAGLFDVFMLSDSSDAHIRQEEEAAWSALRAKLPGLAVYYRWRQRRTKRKAGNVADFCRRWGRRYRYMIVLDADSVMSGDCLVQLVRLMEANPKAGILQTAPQACGHATLHARAQQFAARVTGRLFTMGMHYWQLGEAHYWGHNAIIRVEPFMNHCGLAALPGQGALSGEILSHDFVEAALMRRAGYHVWLLPELAGSYEQQPPNLLAELQRDRRWCQGNLQNARLIAEPGLHMVHRAMLATGAMAYLSAPLWLVYVALGVALWLMGGNVFFNPAGELSLGGLGLWAGTLGMLVVPRVLGIAAVLIRREQRLHGGAWALVRSAVAEALMSALQAPLRMVAHTLFVIGALTGWKLEWKSPPREAQDVAWRQAARVFAVPGVVTLVAGLALAWVYPPAMVWLTPVAVPLLLAVPMVVMSGATRLGERVRDGGWLLVPEETWTPAVLRKAWALARG